MTESTRQNIQPDDLKNFCTAAMVKAGLSQEDAALSAHVFVTTDTWGTFTHGTRQIRGLMQNARRGRLVATAKEKIVAEGPSWAIIDACDGMPPSISYRSVELAVTKARQSGMCYIGIRGSSHYGAAGFYANMIAENDMIGMSMCNVEPCMTVPGGKSRVSGNQPNRLRRTHRHRPHRHARYCHQCGCGHQNIRGQKRRAQKFPTPGW